MKMKTKMSLAVVSVLSASAVAFAATSSARWTLNGALVSSDVRMINGKPYVALADVARAMKMGVVKTGSTYNVRVTGGATQVNGVRQGKIGDQLASNKWGLMVTGVREVDEYTEVYSQAGQKLVPKGANDKLVIVDAVLRNNVQRSQTPMLTERVAGNTALADDQGQSYAPIDFDARQEMGKMGSYAATTMLPAAKVKFALVFSVPRDTKPSALVFSFLNYPDDVGGKGTDVRVTF